MRIQIVDVTLRDGGYRNNFGFSLDFAKSLYRDLSASRVNYTEVGYCNGSLVRDTRHGLTSKITPALIDALTDQSELSVLDRSGICVMVHPHNVMEADIQGLVQSGTSLIRVCLRHTHLDEGLKTISTAAHHGALVSANIVRATELPLPTIKTMARAAEAAGADVVCIADSNGSMIPADVSKIIGALSYDIGVPLGYHAHNHLTLALANAIAAVDAGANYIDASVGGMGKGAGNLHLAAFVAYLERTGVAHDFDLVKILEITAESMSSLIEINDPLPPIDILLGTYNLSFDVKRSIASELSANYPFKEIQRIAEQRRELRANGSGRGRVADRV